MLHISPRKKTTTKKTKNKKNPILVSFTLPSALLLKGSVFGSFGTKVSQTISCSCFKYLCNVLFQIQNWSSDSATTRIQVWNGPTSYFVCSSLDKRQGSPVFMRVPEIWKCPPILCFMLYGWHAHHSPGPNSLKVAPSIDSSSQNWPSPPGQVWLSSQSSL